MTTRTDIMDQTGAPRELTDLTGEEVRALRALADAGMIAPLGAAPPHAGAGAGAGAGAAGTAPRAGGAPPRETQGRKARQREVQGTLMAA
jgi:hypothetical protein